MPCSNHDSSAWTELLGRRSLFTRMGAGMAGIALASLLNEEEARASTEDPGPMGTHHPPRARAVIQLFQHGGPSHMDLLDPKPELSKRDGQPMPSWFTDLVAISSHGGLLGVPFKFHKAGDCGVEYSEILPHTAKCADDIAVIRSMYTEHNNHEQALWHMHTGRIVTGRPAARARRTSGINRSSAQSPPPITFPARADASAGPAVS